MINTDINNRQRGLDSNLILFSVKCSFFLNCCTTFMDTSEDKQTASTNQVMRDMLQ